jgi:MFS family permease
MYDITSSAWDLGLVGLFQFLPALIMTLPAGHVADRLHRGRIFASCMGAQALITLLLIVATEKGFTTRELILAISVAPGVARAFQMLAQQALIPLLVPSELLPRAIALSSSGMQIAIICGPALDGLLYTTGPVTVYSSCVVLLLASVALPLVVRYPHRPSALAATWGTVLAGFSFVWQRKVLLGATSLDLFAVLPGGATALLPIYARDILHTGPAGLGRACCGPRQRPGLGG